MACGVFALSILGCGGSGAPGTETKPVLYETRPVVPSDGLPAGLSIQPANNNLDVALLHGRVFFAFRTAPNHFASADATIHVLSSADQVTWEHEATFQRGTDLREPRFLAWNGELFLFISVLGDNPLAFEPAGVIATKRLGPGRWTEPVWVYRPGFLAWRTRVINGVPYMLGYLRGENLYNFETGQTEVHFLTTVDGWNWVPVVADHPVVWTGGGSEADIAILDDGSLVAVVRNEEGDEQGFGSLVCHAPAQALADWECEHDPRKFDSPLVFRHERQVYLIARRNLTETGNFDLGLDGGLSHRDKLLRYDLDYWQHPKRCSLWRVDPDTLAVEFVLDLPSRGDTCFPGLIAEDDRTYQVYNYTSPLEGADLAWLDGQFGPTRILRTRLVFE